MGISRNSLSSGPTAVPSRAGPHETRFGELSTRAVQYGAKRGQLLGQETVDLDAIARLDREFADCLKSQRRVARDAPHLCELLRAAAADSQDRAHLEAMQEIVTSRGIEIGIEQARHRNPDDSTRRPRFDHRDVSDYLESRQDLCSRYPGLAQAACELGAWAEKRGRLQVYEAEEAAVQIFRGTHPLRWLTQDIERVAAVFEHTTPNQCALLDEVFRTRYDRSMIDDLRRAFHGRKKKYALDLFHGPSTQAAADLLSIALESPLLLQRRRLEFVQKVLSDTSDEMRLAVIAEFDNRLKTNHKPSTIDQLARRRFSGDVLDCALAFINGNHARAEAVNLHELCVASQQRQVEACRKLESLTTKRREETLREYRSLYSRSLRDAVEGDFAQGPLRDWMLATLEHDAKRAMTAKLRAGIEQRQGLWIAEIVHGQDSSFIENLIHNYEETYASNIWVDVKEAFLLGKTPWRAANWLRPGFYVAWLLKPFLADEHAMVSSLLTNGQLADAELIEDCVAGAGTDEQGIDAITCELTKDQAAFLEADFRRRFDRDLRKRLALDLSGDDQHDAFERLKGKPETFEEMMSALVARHQYERVHRHRLAIIGHVVRSLVGKMTRDFQHERRLMNEDVQAAQIYFDTHIQGREPTHVAAVEFEVLVRRAQISCDAFRAAKNYISNVGANNVADIGAFALGLAVQVSTGSLLFAVGTIVMVSGVGRWAFKVGFKGGQAYGKEERAVDLARMITDMASLGIGIAKFGRYYLRKALGMVAKTSFRQAVLLPRVVSKKSRYTEFVIAKRKAEQQLADRAADLTSLPCDAGPDRFAKTGIAAVDRNFSEVWEALESDSA